MCMCVCVHKLTECSVTFQRVRDEYISEGWTKHHTQMLEYEETDAQNSKPSISCEVPEPADDKQKNWMVTIISNDPVSCASSLFLLFEFQLSSFLHIFALLCTLQFEKSVVDRLTERHNIPVTHFGIEWIGSSDTIRCSTVRKIKLLGVKGPSNYFTIFLPKKALEPERKSEGMHVWCMCASNLI